MSQYVIAANVQTFLESASVAYGRIQAEIFGEEMFNNLGDYGMQSPIEDLFWIALHLQCAAERVPVNPDIDLRSDHQTWYGVFSTPQAKIDSYRVDFLLERFGFGERAVPVIVELDGHEFHDKDKRQRSYEKARDRHLVKRGYRVLHFTGSDVVADPYRVAFEALETLGAITEREYDPSTPLGFD